ncbi:MAG: hypothetical protein FWE44_06015 [Defluviitaleaceae bacterium]|nr:hypothetical protein [Defluviitaleaceae bacterium]
MPRKFVVIFLVASFFLGALLGFILKPSSNSIKPVSHIALNKGSSVDLYEEESFAEINPIDRFFAEIESEIDFQVSTGSMVVNGFVVATAWKAEIENAYEILISMTQNDFVKETLHNEMHHYMEYVRNLAEINAMIDASNAFWYDYDDDLLFGSLARITRSWRIAQMYRDKALSLLERLQVVNSGWHQFDGRLDFSLFVFDAEDFLEWMKQEFPELWRE